MIVFWKQQLSGTEGDLMTNLCMLSCNLCSQMSSVTQYPVTKLPLPSICSLPMIVLIEVSLRSFPSEK